MRIPLATDLKIKAFASGAITDYDSGMTNSIVTTKNGRTVTQQRPSFDFFELASAHIGDARGRGVYYWDSTSSLYIVNNDSLCKGSQSNTIGTISTGTKRCKFSQVGVYLFLVDAENNEAWTITTGDVVTQITDADFPTTLAHGGPVLNGRAYVMNADGVIYNSADGDPASWGPLDFVDAERRPDGGEALDTHHDNIVAFGPRSIEFLYDNANPVGSLLNRRNDAFYTLGCHSGESIWNNGDALYFIGVENSVLGVYKIEGFGKHKISNDEIDAFLTQSIVKDSYSAVGSGIGGTGSFIYLITLYSTPSDISPTVTIGFDITSGLWGFYTTGINSHTHFPLVDFSIRDGLNVRYGEGILTNGDLISINDNLTPTDSVVASRYIVEGYIDDTYYEIVAAGTDPIDVTLRLGQNDFGINNKKFCSEVSLVGDTTTSAQTVTVKTADENNDTFTAGRTIDTSAYQTLTRNGSFRRRNHELSHSSTELEQLEALEIEVESGIR